MENKIETESNLPLIEVKLINSKEQRSTNIIKLRKREDGAIYYVLAEGLVANLLGLPTHNIQGKTVKEALGQEMAEIFEPLFEKAFSGEIVQYSYQINDYALVTLLVPTFEEGKVIEVNGTSIDITDHKNLQEKIIESEKFYRLITENSSDIITMIDKDGIIKYISYAIKKILGYQPDNLVGRNIFELINWDDNERICNLFLNTIENKATGLPFEARIKKADGSYVYLEAIANNQLNEPNIQALIINARDITERKEVLRKLEESEERFRTMVEKLPSGTLYRKGDRIWINKRAEEITGYKSEELNDINKFFNLLFGIRVKDIYEIYNKDREEGLKASRLFPIIRKDGTIRYVKFSGYCDDKHEFWILHDVSELNEMQNKLISTNNILESIFEVTRDAIIIAEPVKDIYGKISDFKISHKNKTADNLALTLSNKKAVYITDIFHFIKISGYLDKLNKVIERNESIEFEAFQQFNDSKCWYKVYATPFRNGILLICTDITKIKKNEEDLNKYIEHINNTNEVLQKNTEELEKLYIKVAESERQLKETLTAKDRFFGIIAHDLKNSLSGFLSLIKEITKDFNNIPIEELSSILFTIKEATDNLYLMLDNLLYWSRLQRKMIKYEPVELNLFYELNENILDLFTKDLTRKQIIINNKISPEIKLWADKNMTRIILQNLISNAIKYSNIGDKIELFSEEWDNNSLLICVKDSGIGMQPEILEKIFKLDANIIRKGTMDEMGSGIGLIITKELLDIQNGKVWVESQPNKGTCFRFTLPLPT